MEGHIKPYGGEFWFDDKIFSSDSNNLNNENLILLSGGQSAIDFILNNINFKDDEYLLMPSYLCPTILYNINRRKIQYIFYEINEDLSINLEDLETKINYYKIKAVFFINYFGFFHQDSTLKYLRTLQNKGIILIEDGVQMLWFSRSDNFIGDYIFNSFRKFLPIDGSIVLCNKTCNLNEINDEYSKLIGEARVRKTEYIKSGIGIEEEFLYLFKKADEAYYDRDEAYGMDIDSKLKLNKVDYPKIKKLREENYKYIYQNLKNCRKLSILFNSDLIKDNVPLGLPICINNRDLIRKKLREYSIFCPVHWDIRDQSWAKDFLKSKKLSECILTIPIDWRYDKKDLDYFLSTINKLLT